MPLAAGDQRFVTFLPALTAQLASFASLDRGDDLGAPEGAALRNADEEQFLRLKKPGHHLGVTGQPVIAGNNDPISHCPIDLEQTPKAPASVRLSALHPRRVFADHDHRPIAILAHPAKRFVHPLVSAASA